VIAAEKGIAVRGMIGGIEYSVREGLLPAYPERS
jgi:hypothetical protein